MLPLAGVLLMCGDRALDVVRKLERSGKKVPATAFKIAEGLRVPADFDKVIADLLAMAADDKINPDRLRKVTMEVLRHRWWTWHLLHPDMPNEYLHPTRRMSSCVHFTRPMLHAGSVFVSVLNVVTMRSDREHRSVTIRPNGFASPS